MSTPAGTWGVTPNGFNAKPLDTTTLEVDAGLQTILGSSSGTEPDGTIPNDSYAGQIKVLFVDLLAAQWDGQEAVYNSFNPGAAGGQSLDSIGDITGSKREPAEFSTVTAILAGTIGTTILNGKLASTLTTSVVFEVDSDAGSVTLASATAWAGSTPYALYAAVTNANNIYVCIGAGTSNASGGPSGSASPITDGTATWAFVGAGTGYATARMVATVAGPYGAKNGDLSQITTPVSGWSGIYNAIAAIPGALVESDPAYRLRRSLETAGGGGGTRDAIRSALLAVNAGSTDPTHPPVLSVNVLVNDGDTEDANGLPPHSVECIVNAPSTPAADIARAILDNVGAGIDTVGNTTTTINDAEGNPQTVRWTQPEDVNIYVAGTLYYDATKWPPGTSTSLIAAYATSAIITHGSDFPVGQSVRSSPLSAAVFDEPAAVDSSGAAIIAPAGSTAMAGVVDVNPLNIDVVPSPSSSAAISITPRQIARFDKSRIAWTVIAEAP